MKTGMGKTKGLYLDKHGNEIDITEHNKLFDDLEYRRIGHERVGKYVVSTIWLGWKSRIAGIEPTTFETMVFLAANPGDENSTDVSNFESFDEKRYSTLKQAKAGHKRMVKKWSVKFHNQK